MKRTLSVVTLMLLAASCCVSLSGCALSTIWSFVSSLFEPSIVFHDPAMYIEETYILEETNGSYETELYYEASIKAQMFLPNYTEVKADAEVVDFYIDNSLGNPFGSCVFGLELKYKDSQRYQSVKQQLISNDLFSLEQMHSSSKIPEIPINCGNFICYLAGGEEYTLYSQYFGFYCFNDEENVIRYIYQWDTEPNVELDEESIEIALPDWEW